MSKPHITITYAPRPDATPERELDALAAVYRVIRDGHVEKKAARPGRPDSAKGGSENDSSAKTIIPKPS